MKKVISFADKKKLFKDLCSLISETAEKAIADRGRFSLVLSGGNTPRSLYETLSSSYRETIDWSRTFLFWGDERFVPQDHPESNYRTAAEALISHVPIPPENVFPVPTGERTTEKAAKKYEKSLRTFFQGEKFPRFDLVLLGLGEDGHTASLYKGDKAVNETKRWAAAARAPQRYPVRDRITLTLSAINSARTVVMLVTGEKKREILKKVLKNEGGYPAEKVEPAGRSFVFTDLEGF
jgi:6-phosphogluconolactonase